MATSKTVDDIVEMVRDLSPGDREDLLLRLAQIDDLLDDLDDVKDLLRAARESSRPFEEFLAEVKKERQ